MQREPTTNQERISLVTIKNHNGSCCHLICSRQCRILVPSRRMHQESFKTNEQTKTKITTTTKQPWKTLFCCVKCHPVSSSPRRPHPATSPATERLESSFRWPPTIPTMHTPSPQFLSDATDSDVQFPVSRNAARRSVHCHS